MIPRKEFNQTGCLLQQLVAIRNDFTSLCTAPPVDMLSYWPASLGKGCHINFRWRRQRAILSHLIPAVKYEPHGPRHPSHIAVFYRLSQNALCKNRKSPALFIYGRVGIWGYRTASHSWVAVIAFHNAGTRQLVCLGKTRRTLFFVGISEFAC